MVNPRQKDIDISIIVLAYFHENYIAQALESILMQKTSLRYEILVGDDASQDRTPEIIREYADQHSDVIIPILRKQNLGATGNGLDLILHARGQYIAILEGDDFWLDPEKLQKQWEFLKSHPEFMGCGGKCLIVDEDGIPDYTKFPHFANSKKIYTMEDYLNTWDMPVQANTMMFRNFYRKMDRDKLQKICCSHPVVGDKSHLLLRLLHGPIYCSNDVLSCYRFVIKKGGHNWFSIHHANKYWQYDGFMYPCRLEANARKELGFKGGHLGNRKDYHFCSFVEALMREPSLKRLRYLMDMIVHSHQPLRYTAMIAKALIEMEEM